MKTWVDTKQYVGVCQRKVSIDKKHPSSARSKFESDVYRDIRFAYSSLAASDSNRTSAKLRMRRKCIVCAEYLRG